MEKKKICLDLDDTLLPNSFFYSMAIWRCGFEIGRKLREKAPHPLKLVQMQNKIDEDLVKRHGFGVNRFSLSWVETYKRLTAQADISFDKKFAQKLQKIASRFTRGPFVLYPGVRKTLNELVSQGHELHLITAGDKKLQLKKIRETGIRNFFKSIQITSLSKKEAMANVADGEPQNSIMVDDSKKHIVSALELGMQGVWIPSETWTFADAVIKDGKFYTIYSLAELPRLLRERIK